MLAKEEGINQNDPYKLVEVVATNTFERVKSEQSQLENNPDKLKEILQAELLPYVDHRFAAFKVLGKYVRNVPREQLIEYVDVFREYLVDSYTVGLSYYEDQEVEFEPATNFSNKKSVTVKATIKDDVRPDILLAFKMRKTRDGSWKAFDLVAEGISMISSKQSQYEPILRKHGVEEVIRIMKSEINSSLTAKNQIAAK